MQTAGSRVSNVLASMWHARHGSLDHAIAQLVGACTDAQADALCSEGEELLVRLARAGQLVELRGEVEDRAARAAAVWDKVLAVVEQLEAIDEDNQEVER